jgi:two-component system cell cycle response regulator
MRFPFGNPPRTKPEDLTMSQTTDTNGQKTFILIVEDSLTQAVFLRRILEKAGYAVSLAGNGVEALDFLAVQPPALIISDVMMPIMDGYTLCQRTKAQEKFRKVPFMLLTSLSEPADIFKGLESGADFYSIKPYDGAVLLERVKNILHNATGQYATNAQSGIDVNYAGQKYSISAGRTQILDLLLATFENIVRKNNDLIETNNRLTDALEANKTLRGLIPICGYCKKIRDDQGYWNQVETFVAKHSAAQFSHGICPTCFDKQMKSLGLKNNKPELVAA